MKGEEEAVRQQEGLMCLALWCVQAVLCTPDCVLWHFHGFFGNLGYQEFSYPPCPHSEEYFFITPGTLFLLQS